MAIKDVEEYYNSVCQDYTDMIEALHDMEEEATKGLISPDQLEQMKESIIPLKTNYMRISYIMYLLNKPTKFQLFLNKLGIKTRNKQYSKKIDDSSTLEAVRKENLRAIEEVKKTK